MQTLSPRWLLRALLLAAAAQLAACGNSSAPLAAIGAPSAPVVTPADPATLVLKAETVLPPGQSGFVSVAGQAEGQASGAPGDYGPHLDDQRDLYWSFKAKPGVLGSKPGVPFAPKAGVQVYRDDYGVPIVYADKLFDLWYGVGYSIAQDRLFLMDAVRRTALGSLAELTGCGAVPADLQARVSGYTAAEYQAFFDKLTPDAKDAVNGYVAGANAWVAQLATNPDALPAEYGLLSSQPQPFTAQDVLGSGVYITRFVAAEGGSEWQNIALLKTLSARYGSARAGKDAFQDLIWQDDSKAVTSVPVGEGSFSNHPVSAEGRDAVFERMADWAVTLPETIRRGDGTGHSTAPVPCSQPSLAAAGNSSAGLAGAARREIALLPKPVKAQVKRMVASKAKQQRETQQKIVLALAELRAYLHGGSYAFALAPKRTRDRGTLMVSGPQLGYSYPLLLVEYEIHGAGYDARGSSVPILPVVGIGYTEHAAWGLTTGYSKTIDSFVETLCSTAQITAGTCRADQYFHNNVWKDMSCRTETLNYRAAQSGVPVGPPELTQSNKVCRTVHGPLVTRDDAAGLGRSLSYAMWMRETETIEGIREWNKAKSFAEFDAAMKKVTWNENTTVATRDGHIAYYHPGLHFARNAQTDQRLPIPGTGAFDHTGLMPFEQTPQVRDPAQGFLANWNNKPAIGWLDGEGLGNTSRPGGPGQRVTHVLDKLGTRSDWAYSDLMALDQHTGTIDPRARQYRPVMSAFRTSAAASLSEVQKAALDLVLGWDAKHYGPGIDLANETATDGPAATVFGVYVTALRDELFAALKEDVLDSGVPDSDPNNPAPAAGLTSYGRVSGVGSHVFDQSVMDNVVVRVLDPTTSGITNRRDWAGGRSRDAVMLAALDTALARLATSYNGGTAMTVADLAKATRVHPRSRICSLTGVIGPGSDTLPGTSCVTMPYQDRGSWVHRVGYEKP
ncbi:MAG: penicillin acylase family protein [Pseudomonadota bacterium]